MNERRSTKSIQELKAAITDLLAVLAAHDYPEVIQTPTVRSDISNAMKRAKYAVDVVALREETE